MKPARVELDIKELVLMGVPMIDRISLSKSVEAELKRLLAMHSDEKSFAEREQIEVLNGGSLQLKNHSRISSIGVHLARTIYRGLENEDLA